MNEINVSLVLSEIEHQKKESSFNKGSLYFDKDIESKVTELIENILFENRASLAYKLLDELGMKAVPYIIKHMDDRRSISE